MKTERVSITPEHAGSLIALVKYFKGMIEAGNASDEPWSSKEGTTFYCDELLGDLGE